MTRMRRMILLPLLALFGMVGGTIQPAMATTAVEVEFVVTITTPPVGYAVLFPGQSGTINVSATTACAAEVLSAMGGTNAGTCTITGSGIVGPGVAGGSNCGTWGFWLWGAITIDGVFGLLVIVFHVHGTDVGSFLVGTGPGGYEPGTQTGVLAIEGDMMPTNGSCAAGTLTQFTMTATATGLFN